MEFQYADAFVNVVLWIIGGTVAVILLRWMRVGVRPKSEAQDTYVKAQALQQAILRDHFPNRPRPHELAEKTDSRTLATLRSDDRFDQARNLYLEALMLDSSVNYGSDWKQKELNKVIANNELMLIHRQREELEKSLEHGQRAVDVLEKLAKHFGQDQEVLSSLSIAYFRFGELNHVLGRLDVAKSMYVKGLALDERLGDTEGEGMYRVLMNKL